MTTTERRPYSEILAEYKEQFPLLRHYLDVIDHARPDGPMPITEPHDGVNVMEAIREACIRAGYEITHPDQFNWAYQQMRSLLAEVEEMAAPPVMDLDDTIVRYYFLYMACVPTPDEWLEQIEEQKMDDAAEWVQSIADNPKLLADLAYIAMPELLRLTIARDAKRLEQQGTH